MTNQELYEKYENYFNPSTLLVELLTIRSIIDSSLKLIDDIHSNHHDDDISFTLAKYISENEGTEEIRELMRSHYDIMSTMNDIGILVSIFSDFISEIVEAVESGNYTSIREVFYSETKDTKVSVRRILDKTMEYYEAFMKSEQESNNPD